jgi:photosystem II stability/assembly factor-like uncharacterized protein
LKYVSPQTISNMRLANCFLPMLICFGFVAGAMAQQHEQCWEWQNPLPQGNSIRDLYFVDHETGWAVGEAGTILHTDDGGNTWQVQASGTRSYLNAVHFTNRQTGWAAGTNGVLLHTADAGHNWTLHLLSSNVYLVDVYFLNHQIGWVLGNRGTLLKHPTAGRPGIP